MSAFVVQPKTIAIILDGLALAENTHESGLFYGIHRAEGLPALSVFDAKGRESLGKSMYEMNVRAVCARYNETPDQHPLEKIPTLGDFPSAHQMLKSLHCLLYQCSEGDVPEEPLYKQLQGVAHNLADRIATATPEYNAAKWG